MLARLDELPGVSRSWAECSGYVFSVELAEGAEDATAARALEVLGRGSRLLAGEEAEAQHEARRRGEPWVSAAGARALSYVEGRMVGARVSTGVASELDLGADERARLAEAVREGMFTHVERLHAGLASAGRFFQDWPQLAQRITARCAAWLPSGRATALLDALVGHFASPPPAR